MILSIVAAVSKNGVIGSNGTLPWKLSDDLKFFKSLTSGHTILMGRKTFESIGKPLPNRKNIVITRQQDYDASGIEIYSDLEATIQTLKTSGIEEIFIIGGGEIYSQLLPNTDKIYLTEVNVQIEGDTFFPHLDWGIWSKTSILQQNANDRNQYSFEIFEITRI